jgi:hypothetical protein
MSEDGNPAMMEFLAWISSRRRTYAETMEAWRSTCPRHTVWEDALADGLIEVADTLQHSEVMLTLRGRTLVEKRPSRTA